VTTGARAYSNLYGIGDSLSDIGNLFFATGGAGNPATALPQDPPYFEGRFADGPVFIERLYEALGLGTMLPSIATGTNFAVGGARTRYHAFDGFALGFDPLTATGFDPALTITGFDPVATADFPATTPSAFDSLAQPFSMRAQVDTLILSSGGSLDSLALYSLWIGANDVSDSILAGLPSLASLANDPASKTYAEALIAQSADDVGLAINQLVGAGADYLLVPNVPDLSLVPEVLAYEAAATGAADLARELTVLFNDLVDAELADIDAEILRLDTFTFLQEFVADAALQGINATQPCFTGFVGVPGTACDNPEDFVFFDIIHPTAATHEVLGRLALQAVPLPAPMLLMVPALVALIGFRRNAAHTA
jgi:phospholipase/lecithinase/hemolysin